MIIRTATALTILLMPFISGLLLACGTAKQTELSSTQVGVEVESCIPDIPPSQPEVTVIALHDEAEFEFIPVSE